MQVILAVHLYRCKIWGILAILPLSHSFFRKVWPHQILFVICPLLLSVFGLNFVLNEDGKSAHPQIIWQTCGLTERQCIYFEHYARILSIVQCCRKFTRPTTWTILQHMRSISCQSWSYRVSGPRATGCVRPHLLASLCWLIWHTVLRWWDNI
jgi:hypothetical protein